MTQNRDDNNLDDKKFGHNLDIPSNQKNFDQKIYMFPESYNQLRKELHDNYPTLWAIVGYRMAYRAEEFVEYMNAALELEVVFDSAKVDYICTTFLEALRKKRGFQQ